MRGKVFWIPGPWRGRLGIVARPRGGDWLDDEVRAWRGAGVDVVVSLLEGESASFAAAGIEFRSYPIPDRGVPGSRESVAALTSELAEALNGGKHIAVHCRQGLGRSPLIAAAVLVAAGQDPDIALQTIERSRGLKVPETTEQRQWITDFASWLAARTDGLRRGEHA